VKEIIENINLIKVIVFLTLLFAIFSLKRNQNHNHNAIVLLLLWINFITEIFTLVLKSFHYQFNKVTTINIILVNCLWLYLIGAISFKKNVSLFLIVLFVIFGSINFLFFQGMKIFNYYTFIVGSFFYVTFFLVESFIQLRNENFQFFFSNTYLLLSAPILFYFGISLMFAFVSREITEVKIIGDKDLFTIVIYYVNIVYYAMLSIYISKEKNE